MLLTKSIHPVHRLFSVLFIDESLPALFCLDLGRSFEPERGPFYYTTVSCRFLEFHGECLAIPRHVFDH